MAKLLVVTKQNDGYPAHFTCTISEAGGSGATIAEHGAYSKSSAQLGALKKVLKIERINNNKFTVEV